MKRLLLAIMAVGIFSTASYASNADLFELNEAKINAELTELNELEAYVDMNENATLNSVYSENASLVQNMNLSYSPEGMLARNDFSFDDIEWGSFAWGFCCWPIGVFTVLLNDDKGKNHNISFFIGWGTSIVLSAISGAAA